VRELYRRFVPNRIVLLVDSAETAKCAGRGHACLAENAQIGRPCGALTFAAWYVVNCPFNPARWGSWYNTEFHRQILSGGTMEKSRSNHSESNPFTLIGPELKAGDTSARFSSCGQQSEAITLKDTGAQRAHHQRGAFRWIRRMRCADQALQ